MGFVMVDAEKRFLQGKGESLGGLESNEQCRGQSRSLGGGDGVKLVRLQLRCLQRRLGHGNQIP
jgi:hypothetical protein